MLSASILVLAVRLSWESCLRAACRRLVFSERGPWVSLVHRTLEFPFVQGFLPGGLVRFDAQNCTGLRQNATRDLAAMCRMHA